MSPTDRPLRESLGSVNAVLRSGVSTYQVPVEGSVVRLNSDACSLFAISEAKIKEEKITN